MSATKIDRKKSPAGEERVLLSNVSWDTYEQLLADLASQSAPRLTYDKGILEIMSPGPSHERLTHLIETIIERFAERNDINICCLRSTTFRSKSLGRGFEPDSCFYIQNEVSVRNKERIDLQTDPPPDLIVEIDISNSSIDKFPIFAQMQVPEIWHYDGDKFTVFKLSSKKYVQSKNSTAFPALTTISLSRFIQQNKNLPSLDFLRALRKWIEGLEK